ncbi:MAG: restriction endonuclease [Gammaproteobacteria bacterium]|nr:restriction endonuclease [Gammaproteobacteria bacterium]MYF01737.1 restriction endonuclease [Gammaproteobacteria bacterium]MYI77351.1 restriction endonuclease [Gammaproteobacteria bacterium]
MKVAAKYSHMNGEEYLLVRRKQRWEEVLDVIHSVDADKCKTKVSEERGRKGQVLYSPTDMNKEFKKEFERRGWKDERVSFYLALDESLMRSIHTLSESIQREKISEAGYEPISSFNQTDFVKDRVAVEVQFGKYAFVAHDLFVKHMSFFTADEIDVGIEIVPMKELEKKMSSGVAYYERDLLNLIRQGRGVPAVPLVLIGIIP